MRLLHITAGLAMLCVALAATAAAGSAQHGSSRPRVCTLFASPTGSDAAPGSLARPIQSVQALVDRLGPGRTGCLLHGLYVGDVSIRHGGTASRPLVLRAAPGVSAMVRGRFWIAAGADWVTVTHLRLDGINATHLPSPTINDNHATFTYDEVTNEHMGGVNDGDGICFLLGDSLGVYGIARYTTIAHSRIHDCGTSNNHNHGIYVRASDYARIVDNWIYDNADRGIQLYPDAQHTEIRNNIIARNGEGVIFSGDNTYASSDNELVGNIIVDSRIRYNVEYYWSGPVGTGNVVSGNCVSGGHEGDIRLPQIGYAVGANAVVAPRFLSPVGMPRLSPGSPCARLAPATAP